MASYTLVKLFDLSAAPSELKNAAEADMLRPHEVDAEAALLAVWVGTRSSSLERPTSTTDVVKVTAWEHYLHKWLLKSGAAAGDVVLLTWGKLSGADAQTLPGQAELGKHADAASQGPRRAVPASGAEAPLHIH